MGSKELKSSIQPSSANWYNFVTSHVYMLLSPVARMSLDRLTCLSVTNGVHNMACRLIYTPAIAFVIQFFVAVRCRLAFYMLLQYNKYSAALFDNNVDCQQHYSDVRLNAITSQITCVLMVCSTVCSARVKENIEAPRHWPLRGDFPVTGDFPSQRASNAEHVSIWCRHHDNNKLEHIWYFKTGCCLGGVSALSFIIYGIINACSMVVYR